MKPWQLAAILVVCCAGAVGLLLWRSHVSVHDSSRLLNTLPLDGALKGYLDVEKLRESGVLEQLFGKKAAEDQEYRDFAQQIGFDYRTDLDSIAVAYANNNLFATLQGRFDWPRLSAYAASQRGLCLKELCSMPASRPNQVISFTLLSKDVLAWAVTDQPTTGAATLRFNKSQESHPPRPDAVMWFSAPGAAFKDPELAPSGTRAFLTPLAVAQDASFSIEPSGAAASSKTAKLEIRMEAPCATPVTAGQLAGVLKQTTDLLSTMIVRDKVVPEQGSLTAVLVSGRFEARAASVTGIWPLDQRVIEGLLSGEVH